MAKKSAKKTARKAAKSVKASKAAKAPAEAAGEPKPAAKASGKAAAAKKPAKPAAKAPAAKAAAKPAEGAAQKAARKAAKKASRSVAAKAVLKSAPAHSDERQSGAITPGARKAAIPASSISGIVRRAPASLPRPSVTMQEVAQRDLPHEYGETGIRVLVRDTEWLFVYWEISSATRAQHGLHPGGETSPLVLRLYEGGSEARITDVPVNDLTSSWYVRVPVAGSAYVVELGIKRARNGYTPLARSGLVKLPRAVMAEDYAPGWEQPVPEVFEQLVQLSGGLELSTRLGSEEFSLVMQRRLRDELSSFSGMLFSGILSSGELSSAGFAEERTAPEAGRDFWLKVGVDVIVYGSTEPDAQVSLMGRPIKLSPDGSFRVRMAFPDGRIEFPVEATSADGVETRRVKPVVERATEPETRSFNN